MSEPFSFRRIAALLCYAFSAFVAFIFVMFVVNRIFWRSGYSVVEDAIFLSIAALIAAAAAIAGYLLKPGSFSLRTMFVGVTMIIVVVAELAYLARRG